jgi:hypothetical protein
MKKNLLLIAALFIVAFVCFSGCKRDEVSSQNENDQFILAENEVITEAVLQRVDDLIDDEISMLEKTNYDVTLLKSAQVEACKATITVQTPLAAKFPKTITLDFGSGCKDSDGNFRAGKIIVHMTGPYWEKNTVRNSKLVDYLYNDLKIAGERQEINKGVNEKGYYIFEVKRSDKISDSKGKLVIERDWKRERIYNRGNDLKTNADDEVWVTGSAKVEKNGEDVVKEITVPLYRHITCQHFESGIIATLINKEKTAELDYGKSGCDDKATWTNGKVTREVRLKTWINYFSLKN